MCPRCIIFYKYLQLTELPDIRARMSPEQRLDYFVPSVLLSVVFTSSVLGALVVSYLVLSVQLIKRRNALHQLERVSKARRLRYVADDQEVVLSRPIVPPNAPLDFLARTPLAGDGEKLYHLFLSQ